jgi:anti-sigma B factor antagonist
VQYVRWNPAVASAPSVRCAPFDRHGWLVVLDGECDLRCAAALADGVGAGISEGHLHFVVDVGGATLLDCAALGALLGAFQPLRREPDASVLLAGAAGIVARFLTVLGVDELFDMYGTRDEAIARVSDRLPGSCEGWRALTEERPEPLLAALAARNGAVQPPHAVLLRAYASGGRDGTR